MTRYWTGALVRMYLGTSTADLAGEMCDVQDALR